MKFFVYFSVLCVMHLLFMLLITNCFNFIYFKHFFLLAKEPVDVCKKILVFLWHMANQKSIRETASVFGLSESTTYYAIKHTGEVMCTVMEDVSTREIFVLCVVMFPHHTRPLHAVRT